MCPGGRGLAECERRRRPPPPPAVGKSWVENHSVVVEQAALQPWCPLVRRHFRRKVPSYTKHSYPFALYAKHDANDSRGRAIAAT